MAMPPAVADVLCKAECQHLFTKDDTRIRCTLNDHCIPLESIDVLERFVGGKKFKKLASEHRDAQLLQKFEPFLIPSQRLKGHLFCALTGQMIKASVEAARKHMKGQRFMKGKERFMEDDMDLLDEPVDDAAKPVRRANHRLNRASDPEAELGSADSSEDMESVEDEEAHAQMDDLLASDDSMACAAGGHDGSAEGDEEKGEEKEAAEADVGMHSGGAGKRKQRGREEQGGEESGRRKRKKRQLAPQLVDLQVKGAEKQKSERPAGKVLIEASSMQQRKRRGNGKVPETSGAEEKRPASRRFKGQMELQPAEEGAEAGPATQVWRGPANTKGKHKAKAKKRNGHV